MAHIHSVFDSDTHFVIDPITRQLKNETSKKASVVQFDHNSECFTFELPRIIEGHDMTTCNVVQIHYLNIDAKTKKENKGLYEVSDLQISPDDENTVICSWLISQNATQLDGSISFLVRFSCVTEGEPKYIWQTAPYTTITVTTGINNADYIVEEYADILQQWKQELEELAAAGSGLTEIPDDSISTAKMQDKAVTPAKLDRKYVTEEDVKTVIAHFIEKVEKLPTTPKENELVALVKDEVFDWDNVEYTESLEDVKGVYNIRFSTLPETINLTPIKGKNISSMIVFYNLTTNHQIMLIAGEARIEIAFDESSNRLRYLDVGYVFNPGETNEFIVPENGWYKGDTTLEKATKGDLEILNGIYNVFIVDFGKLTEGGSSIIDSSIDYIMNLLVNKIVVPIEKGFYVAESGQWYEFAKPESLPRAEGVAF